MRSALLLASSVLTLVLAACGGPAVASTPRSTMGPAVVASSPMPTLAAATPTATPCVIPQHGGGDRDGDNFGAPSDGDGCDR